MQASALHLHSPHRKTLLACFRLIVLLEMGAAFEGKECSHQRAPLQDTACLHLLGYVAENGEMLLKGEILREVCCAQPCSSCIMTSCWRKMRRLSSCELSCKAYPLADSTFMHVLQVWVVTALLSRSRSCIRFCMRPSLFCIGNCS